MPSSPPEQHGVKPRPLPHATLQSDDDRPRDSHEADRHSANKHDTERAKLPSHAQSTLSSQPSPHDDPQRPHAASAPRSSPGLASRSSKSASPLDGTPSEAGTLQLHPSGQICRFVCPSYASSRKCSFFLTLNLVTAELRRHPCGGDQLQARPFAMLAGSIRNRKMHPVLET